MNQSKSKFLKTIITTLKTTTTENSSSRTIDYINPNKKKLNKPSLHSKISPLGEPQTRVSPVIDEWVQSRRIRFGQLKRIILDLRKRRRFSQALEVSEWMQKEGRYTITAIEHAVQLDLIGRVHGFVSAETYFNNLADHERIHKTYGALLHCYVRQNQIEKALTHFEIMKQNGLASTTVSFKDIMSLYTNNNRLEEVLDVFTQMKEHGISPDNLSYRLCINAYGQRSEIEGMQKILEEMESRSDFQIDWNTYAVAANLYTKAGLNHKARAALMKAEERLDGTDGEGYNYLIFLHGKLGNKTDVFRTWELQKSACKRCVNNDYIAMLKSLVYLRELEEATQVLFDWESSGNFHDFRVPNVVILGCITNGMYQKAEMILRYSADIGIKIKPNSWQNLAKRYLDNGKVKNAVECIKSALSVSHISESWKPRLKMITRLLVLVVKVGEFEDLQILIDSLRNGLPLNRQRCHGLFDSCTGNDEEDVLLRNMRANMIVQDEETELSLSKKGMLVTGN